MRGSPLAALGYEDPDEVKVLGDYWFVNTISGNNSFRQVGTTKAKAYATVGALVSSGRLRDGDCIFVTGDVREEVVLPLGAQGLKVVGLHGGRTRHDDGVRWREPASGATVGGALLTSREQGCEFHNILFVPKSDATALRLRRAEDATWPDGSHAIVKGCKFIGAAAATTIGLEDHGGTHHNLIWDCEFMTLNNGIKHTVGAGIASPLRWHVGVSWFEACVNGIVLPANESIIGGREGQGNIFDDGTVIVDTRAGTAGLNRVTFNQFSNSQATINNANGYFGHASDFWRNYSTDTAAMTVGVPA